MGADGVGNPQFFSIKMVVLVVVVHLVVFWSYFGRVFSPFNQDFMVFVNIFWLLIQSKIIIPVKLSIEGDKEAP